MKATLNNDKDRLLQVSRNFPYLKKIVQEDGKEIVDDINHLFTFLKVKALKEEDFNEALVKIEGLSEENKTVLQKVLKDERQKLLNTQKVDFVQDLPVLTGFHWRFEIEVSSKERKRSFVPNFLLNFDFKKYGDFDDDGNRYEENQNLCVNSDFGTLGKLCDDFGTVNKYPRSISYRKMTRGIKRIADKKVY